MTASTTTSFDLELSSSDHSTVSSKVDKKIKEKFFPCTSSFLDYIREKIVNPPLRFFVIQIQTLYPFECRNGGEFRLDPRFLAQKLGYQSERTPQRFIAKLIKEGILERVSGKYAQLYRWLKKSIPVPTPTKPASSEKRKNTKPKSPKPPKPPAPAPVIEEKVEVTEEKVEVTEEKVEEISNPGEISTTDPHFGIQPTRNQWGQRSLNANPHASIPDGPWKNEHRRIKPEFLAWKIDCWIDTFSDRFKNVKTGKEDLAEPQVLGYYRVSGKTSEDRDADAQLKYERLEADWNVYCRHFEKRANNVKTRIDAGLSIPAEEQEQFVRHLAAVSPTSIYVEEPAPQPKINPADSRTGIAQEEQGTQGASQPDSSKKQSVGYLKTVRGLLPTRKDEKKEAAANSARDRFLAMGPDDPLLEASREHAIRYGLVEVFKDCRLIGFAEPPESLES